jgi:hypothetical protein
MSRSLTGIRHDRSTPCTSSNSDVSVYTLMKLLGHESMMTSQRYVTAAGTETRAAAAQNKLYSLIEEERLAGVRRTIPAFAGSTSASAAPGRGSQDHSQIRGKH